MDHLSGGLVRALDLIRAWPIWLLFAIATSLTVLVTVPAFRSVLPLNYPMPQFLAVAAWIFFLARIANPATHATISYLQYRRDARYYLPTPISYQCQWSVSRQSDGSYITQLTIRCMVKNRSAEPLYLVRARLVKPRVASQPSWVPVLVRDFPGSAFASAPVSGAYVTPGSTAAIAVMFLVRGAIRRGTRPLKAIIEFEDAEGKRERLRVGLERTGND